MLSHDLRSALSGITGGLRQINTGHLDSSDRLQFDRVMHESVILADLLDSALQLEGFPNGASLAPEAPVNIGAFLEEQSLRWRAQADEKGIACVLRLREPLALRVRLSELQLTRSIGNVVNNAIKYTDTGTVEIAAWLNPAGNLDIAVSDDGPGFSEAALARIFEFKGRPESSAKPGTGLGLHISKSLLDQVGASITITNRRGNGALVRITIPATLFVDDEGRILVSKRALPDLSGIRILLAEDNKTNQLVATQMLQTMNAEVTVASDGHEALQKFEKAHFDLALLDIEMPRMSGLDVLRAIRARGDARAQTPLVALTAYAMREHRERISAAGANGLIPKPLISIEEFGQALLVHLNLDNRKPEPDLTTAPARVDEAAPGAVDQSIYDGLLATIGNESMGELLEKVLEDVGSVKAAIIAGARSKDVQLIRANTHILISVAGAIGATGLQGLAERLNAAAHGNDNTAIAELSEQCISGIASAELFLSREQERFRPIA